MTYRGHVSTAAFKPERSLSIERLTGNLQAPKREGPSDAKILRKVAYGRSTAPLLDFRLSWCLADVG